MNTQHLVAPALACAAALSLALACAAPGPADPEATRDLMRGRVRGAHTGLIDGLQRGPRTEEEWHALAALARRLEDSGHGLLRAGGPRDATWTHAAETLGSGSEATLAALAARDLAAARAAFERLNVACGACHRECSAAYVLPWRESLEAPGAGDRREPEETGGPR